MTIFALKKMTVIKKSIFLLIVITLNGCDDNRSSVINEYVENRGGVEIFRDFSLKHISNLGSITASDSLEIVDADYILKKKKFIQEYNVLINASQSLKNNQEERNLVYAAASDQLAWISELEKRADKGTASALMHKQREIVEMRTMANRIVRYKADQGKVLAKKAKVTYTIRNPLQKDALQEMTRTFIFSADNKKVLDVIQ